MTGVSLAELSRSWRQACQRFAAVHPSFPGARVLRQDPVECLFRQGLLLHAFLRQRADVAPLCRHTADE